MIRRCQTVLTMEFLDLQAVSLGRVLLIWDLLSESSCSLSFCGETFGSSPPPTPITASCTLLPWGSPEKLSCQWRCFIDTDQKLKQQSERLQRTVWFKDGFCTDDSSEPVRDVKREVLKVLSSSGGPHPSAVMTTCSNE